MNEELVVTPLDAHFAALMLRLNGAHDDALQQAAIAVSAWRGAGNTCVPLSEIGDAGLAEKLRATAVVGAPGDFRPLILDGSGRLYLQRYWQYETQLAANLRSRLVDAPDVDEKRLEEGLRKLFGESVANLDSQRVAAATAVRKRFCVITGGPGTGKTRTVVTVLALLHQQFAARGATPRIGLAAPTGKAAARMKESIQHTVEHEPAFAKLRGKLPTEATTLHRLLGVIPNSPFFRHDARRPLALDAVIVDEASMVDLALMAKLAAALPPAARLILLGDKDQLASVEAGNVLGDICDTTGIRSGSRSAEHIAELRTNYRFTADSGIHQVSRLVNAGDADGAIALLEAGGNAEIESAPTPAPAGLAAALGPRVVEGYSAFLAAQTPEEALRRLGDFRILCAVRHGPFGVANINRLGEQALADEGLIEPITTHYHGRPVLIRTNDYPLRLFNGDVGLILRDTESGGELRAFFLDAEGRLRRVLPARLPPHETTFAMTVHKSQGSEFPRMLLILPDRDAAVLTRELIYTGVTRARTKVQLWANAGTLRTAILRRTVRNSGLRDALWTNPVAEKGSRPLAG